MPLGIISLVLKSKEHVFDLLEVVQKRIVITVIPTKQPLHSLQASVLQRKNPSDAYLWQIVKAAV